MDQFEDFKVALRQFVQEVCETIPKEKVPRRLWTRIVRREGGSIDFPQEEHTDFNSVVLKVVEALNTNVPQTFRQVMDAIRKNPVLAATILVDAAGNPIVEEKSQEWWASNELARSFLTAYFSGIGRPAYDESTFDPMFQHLVIDLQSPTIAVTELSPLLNAKLDCERINVAPGLAIRKLSTDELEHWLNQYMENPFVRMHELSARDLYCLDCAIEATYKKGRPEAGGASQQVYENVPNLVRVVRLLTDRNVHVAFTKYISNNMLQMDLGTGYTPRAHILNLEAQLSSSMQQEIMDIWRRINAFTGNSAIRLALRRWDLVAERDNPDDALIDYWIALESLFIQDSKQEVTYRASLRTAAFVGETPEEREEIYGKLKKSYNLRSGIVHGGDPKKGDKSELIGKTRSYLRRALLKILTSDGPFDPKSIESKLLNKGI